MHGKTFFTDDMMDLVVEETNKNICEFQERINPALLTNCKIYLHETSTAEVGARIGSMYARGLLGKNDHTSYLFDDDVRNPMFGATMSKNHFAFLLSKPSFDDSTTCRQDRWKHDRFAAFTFS